MIDGPGDTDRIERDLENTRSRLDATIEALQRKLSPNEMVDQAVTYFKEGGGVEFSRNLGRNIRENPLPVALIGLGLAWLMASNARGRGLGYFERESYDSPDYGRSRSSGYAEYGSTSSHSPSLHAGSEPYHGIPRQPYEAAAYDDLATRAHEAGSRLQREAGETESAFQERVSSAKGAVLGLTRQANEAASSFAERVEAAVASAADRFREFSRRAGAMASDAGDAASGYASRLYGYGQSAAYRARGGAEYAASHARDFGSSTVDYLQERPLLLGALGITVGAALGLLLPSSRYERQVWGGVRENLRDTAREAVSEVGQRAGRVADAVLDTAHEATRREGLTNVNVSPAGLAAAARERVADTAGRVRSVVEETAAAGREALQREMSASSQGGQTDQRQGQGQSGQMDQMKTAQSGNAV